jgi:hypothetical protein
MNRRKRFTAAGDGQLASAPCDQEVTGFAISAVFFEGFLAPEHLMKTLAMADHALALHEDFLLNGIH